MFCLHQQQNVSPCFQICSEKYFCFCFTHYFLEWTLGLEPLKQSIVSEGCSRSAVASLNCSNGRCIPHYFNHSFGKRWFRNPLRKINLCQINIGFKNKNSFSAGDLEKGSCLWMDIAWLICLLDVFHPVLTMNWTSILILLLSPWISNRHSCVPQRVTASVPLKQNCLSIKKHTYVVSCGDASIWNQVKVQRLFLPDGLHYHQGLNTEANKSTIIQSNVKQYSVRK